MDRDHLNREAISATLVRLESRGDWYDNPSDFRAGLRCLAEELSAWLDSATTAVDDPSGGSPAGADGTGRVRAS